MALHRDHTRGGASGHRRVTKKSCNKCLLIKHLDEFPPDARSPDGKQSRCRWCINSWMKDHYRSNPVWSMLRRAKARAKKIGLPFDLTEQDITPLPVACPVFGKPLRISTHPHDPWSYSIDRINNEKGYVTGNVAVMSSRANRLKNDGTLQEFEDLIRWMKAHSTKD